MNPSISRQRALGARILVLTGLCSVFATAATALAGANLCDYGGRIYQEGVTVCQSGSLQLCMNGEWQDQGTFCSSQLNGAVYGGGGYGAGAAEVLVSPPRGPAREEVLVPVPGAAGEYQ